MVVVTISDLTASPRWLAWRATPDPADATKIRKCPFNVNEPAGTARMGSSQDPATWADRPTAEICSAALPAVDGMPHGKRGIGLVLGDYFGTAIGGIDLDDCFTDDSHTELAPWAREVLEEFESYAEVSPSGSGIKIFFTYDPALFPAIQALLRKRKGITSTTEIVNGTQWRWAKLHATDHAPAIEFYVTGQYFTVTGRHLQSSPRELTETNLDSIKFLFELLGPHFENSAPNERRVVSRGRDRTPSGVTFSFVKKERAAGRMTSQEQALAVLLANNEIPGEWIRSKNPRGQVRHLQRIWSKTAPDENATKRAKDTEEKEPAFRRAVNLLRGLAPWRNLFGYNTFASRSYVLGPIPGASSPRDPPPRPVNDTDLLDVKYWLQGEGIGRGFDAHEVVSMLAHDNPFNPVRAYLESLKWDRKARLDEWLIKHAGAPDTPYVRAVSSKWRIAAVARIMEPGIHLKWVMILEGRQNLGKSVLYRESAVKREWFLDHVSDLSRKDALEELQGKWIIEFAEWDAMSRADLSRVKAFLSSAVDHFRPSYGHFAQDYPRQWIGGGSINPTEGGYLDDPTGNMRFCPIKCGVGWPEGKIIDTKKLAAENDQLWAEAYTRYKAGESIWLDTPELRLQHRTETAEREKGDLLEEPLVAYLNEGLEQLDRPNYVVPIDIKERLRDRLNARKVKWTSPYLIAKALGFNNDRIDRALLTRIGNMMTSKQWQRYRAQTSVGSPNGQIGKFYFPPEVEESERATYAADMHRAWQAERQHASPPADNIIQFR